MQGTRAALFGLAIAVITVGAGRAHALPLPDSSTCSSSTAPCLKIKNMQVGATSAAPAIQGEAEDGGVAVSGVGRGLSAGVFGTSGGGYGVAGLSTSGRGVYASSSTNDGVEAVTASSSKSAVYAHNEASSGGFGVYGVARGTGQAIHGENSNSNGWAGFFSGKVGASQYVTFSDARLKRDVADLKYGLAEVLKLRPVTYALKEPGARGQKHIGLIAQEVREVMPELVTVDASSGMLSVDYAALAPILIAGAQQQQRTIDAQAAQLAAQEGRIARLEQRAQPLASGIFGATSGPQLLGLGVLPLGLFLALRQKRERRLRSE